MKNTFLTFCLIISACTTNNTNTIVDTTNFNWLMGEWKRTNEEPGKETYEMWAKINELEYHGTSYTLKNLDTIWQENVKLKKTNKDWNYEVT